MTSESGSDELMPLHRRVAVAKALRRAFQEDAAFRETWTPKVLALELWSLSPEMRADYEDNWNKFWDLRQRRIEHIRSGRYAKLDDAVLNAAFEVFVRKHLPSALVPLDNLWSQSFTQLADAVEAFFHIEHPAVKEPFWAGPIPFPGAPGRDGAPTPDKTTVLQISVANNKNDKDRWIESCFAYRPWGPAGNHWIASWFSPVHAWINFRGILLAPRGVAIMRGAMDGRVHLFCSIRRQSDGSAYSRLMTNLADYGTARNYEMARVERGAIFEMGVEHLKKLDRILAMEHSNG